MSAPDTNIERQQNRHKPSLIGIRAAVVFGALMFVAVILNAVIGGSAPTEETMSGTPEAREDYEANISIDPVEPGTNATN